MGAVGAKDWAGGFLDLKADLQGDTFVGNDPLTPEARAGYLGECRRSFVPGHLIFRARESLRLTFKKANESSEASGVNRSEFQGGDGVLSFPLDKSPAGRQSCFYFLCFMRP